MFLDAYQQGLVALQILLDIDKPQGVQGGRAYFIKVTKTLHHAGCRNKERQQDKHPSFPPCIVRPEPVEGLFMVRQAHHEREAISSAFLIYNGVRDADGRDQRPEALKLLIT